MSIIRSGIPFVKSMLGKMSEADRNSLKNLLDDGSSVAVHVSFDSLPETAVTAVYFDYDFQKYYVGILINEQTQKVLISYNPLEMGQYYQHEEVYQRIVFYEIDTTNKLCKKVNQYCTIEELRRTLDDVSESGGDAWVDIMKQHLGYEEPEEGETYGSVYTIDSNLIAGSNLEVDGELTINDKVNIAGNVYNANGFIQTNQLKTNQIRCLDAGEQTPVVTFQNCNVVINENHTLTIGNTTITEVQLIALLALIENQ